MVWYSHLLKNLPLFVVIHTVNSFSIVSEEGINVFLEFCCFLYDLVDVGNLISGSSPFLNPAEHGKFSVHMLLKPSLENFEHYFASM